MRACFTSSIRPALFVAVLTTAACQGDGSNVNSNQDKPSFDAWVASLYQEPDTGLYIVDWDVPVSDYNELRSYYDRIYNGGSLTVHQANGVDVIWDENQKHELTYCISDSFGNRKQQVVDAMAAATDGWMDAADLTYSYVPAEDGNCTAQNNNVLFDVNPVDSGQYVARAFFPNQPRDQRNVLIDDMAFDIEDPIFTLEGVLEHELGHTLGFRHEHVRADIFDIPFENWLSCVLEGILDPNYRPVTEYDSASVMHYPQCGGTGTLSITELDIAGARSIYGAPTGTQPDPDPDPQPVGTLVINELLTDPPSGYDANGDGVSHYAQDEFIELLNVGMTDLDLSGATISDEYGVRATLPAGTVIAPGSFLLVFGGGAVGTDFPGGSALVVGTLALNNDGDTITVHSAGGDVLDSVGYSAVMGARDQSLVREVEGRSDAILVLHRELASQAASPGTRADGSALSF
jgi:hypothetical protein